jgi:hypothetical protein
MYLDSYDLILNYAWINSRPAMDWLYHVQSAFRPLQRPLS